MSSISQPRINKIVPPNSKADQCPITRRSTIAPASMTNPDFNSATPQNTPANNRPFYPITKKSLLIPVEGNENNNTGGVPINAANAIMGIGRGMTSSQHNHAITPGNTLNSLEQITNRIANNLGVNNDDAGDGRVNKIAPSYERNFNAGLGDLTRRLSSPSVLKSPNPQIPPPASPVRSPNLSAGNESLKPNDWPSSFSDLDDMTNSFRSDKTNHIVQSPVRELGGNEGK